MTAESLLQNNTIDPDKRTVQECCFPFYKYREKTIRAAGTKKSRSGLGRSGFLIRIVLL